MVTHEGGLTVLDATTLEPVGEVEQDGYLRVNPAGDGRHVAVSTAGGFQLLDAGTWAEAHGDHDHYWTSDPTMTDTTYAATEPGHVVVHDGRTGFFDDGTGRFTSVGSADVADPAAAHTDLHTPAPHHGVAVQLSDDSFVVSEGTEDARTGIRVLDPLRLADVGDEVAAALAALDQRYVCALAPCRGAVLVTSHEAFGYLADRYGLQQLGVAGLDPEVKPTPARLRAVVTQVQDAGVRTVSFETEATDAVTGALAAKLGTGTGVLDPLETVRGPGADLVATADADLQALTDGLVCS